VAAGGGGCALANGLVETLISGGGGAGERLVENGDDAEAGAAESAEKRNANSSTSCSDGAAGAWGGQRQRGGQGGAELQCYVKPNPCLTQEYYTDSGFEFNT
jgi:hypothetical protein